MNAPAPRYLVVLMRRPGFDEALVAPHLAFLDELRAQGLLELNGGFADRSGGAYLLRGIASRRVWVMGRVNAPGLYPLDTPTTVLDAIARAGGLFTSRFSGTTEELADLRHAFLVRNGTVAPVDFNKLLREGDLSQNIYLRDGDYLYLPSALSSQVYVLGAVVVPRAVGFMDRVTVLSALASARGTLPGADLGRVLIIRGSLLSPSVATVDYQAILRGRIPDVPLEPQDIVWVPDSTWKQIGGYVRVVLNTFARTVAANEGVRAADRSAAEPTISVPSR